MNLTSTVLWRPIGDQHTELPDVELEILVFDGFLNDTVKAAMAIDDNDRPVWIEQITDEPLTDPQFWTDVPFPGEEK
jgi:hypothetical protein